MILKATNLKKYYGKSKNKTKALDGITFQVMPGEFLGIMGSSGSGKSTLLNCIAAVIQPSGGTISMNGRQIQSLKGAELAGYRGKEIGYLFQNFELLDNLTGRENILLPLSLHGIAEQESRKRLEQLASYLEVQEVLGKFPAQMSGGQKQRLAVAAAILSGKRLLVFDEPTSGLDYRHMLEVSRMIRELAGQGCIVLVVSHDREFMEKACDRIFEMDGRRGMDG